MAGQITVGSAANCWASGNVSASGNPGYFNAAGGFAGSIYEGSKAQDCFTVGSVTSSSGAASAGGFVGRLAGTLTNCYATGTLQGNLDMYLNSEQGIVGTVRSYPSVLSCADLMNTSRGFPMFVSAQDISKPKMDILTIQQVVQEGTYTSRGWDFKDTWVLPSGGSYKLPILRGVGEAAQAALAMPTHLQ